MDCTGPKWQKSQKPFQFGTPTLYINMASIQPVFSKILEVKSDGCIRSSTIILHVKREIFICLFYQKFELLKLFYVQ